MQSHDEPATAVLPARKQAAPAGGSRAEQDAWVLRVLGVDARPAPSVQDGTARLNHVREDALLHGLMDAVLPSLREAAFALKAGRPGTRALIEALEANVAAAAAAKRKEEADAMAAALKTRAGIGAVAFNKLRLRLHAAQSRFEGAIENLKVACTALLETPDFLDDPRSQDPATLQAIERLDERIPAMGDLVGTLEGAIDRMTGTLDPATRQRHADDALKAIAAFGTALEAEPLLAEMEHTDAGAFAIHSAMTAVLDDLSAALRA